jgi:16S rRNA (cytosine1402-N4)-methyltransferase
MSGCGTPSECVDLAIECQPADPAPLGGYGKCALASPGKDTTTGHWEMVGIHLDKPFPLFPNGFPPEIMTAFEDRIGRSAIGNKAASGTEIIKELGEEPRWRQAAKAIVEARKKKPIETTTALSDIIIKMMGKRGRLHPATLIFQALRICVNRELEVLFEGLTKALSLLAQHGRVGAISFHSLEDRIVKNIFRTAATPRKEGKVKLEAMMKLLTKKPAIPSLKEIRLNPRARSAKLRFAEKIWS